MKSRCYLLAVFTILLSLVSLHFPLSAVAQGRPDLVWMRGGLFSPTSAMVFSPDGKYFVTGSSGFQGYPEYTIKLFRLSDKMLLRTFRRSGGIQSIAFTPDSKTVMACDGQTIVFYSVPDGTLIRQINGVNSYIRSAALSADGTILAAATEEKKILLWRVRDGSLLYTLTGHTGGINSIVFSHNGQYLASISGENQDSTVHLWSINTGLLLREYTTLAPQDAYAHQVVFNHDDTELVTGYRKGSFGDTQYVYVQRNRLSDGGTTQFFSRTGGRLQPFFFSPDGENMAYGDIGYNPVAGFSFGFGIVRTVDGSDISSNGMNGGVPVSCMAFTSGGETLAIARNGITFWRKGDGSLLERLIPQTATSKCFAVQAADNNQVLVTLNEGDSFVVRRASDGTVIREISSEGAFFSSKPMGLSRDGSLVAGPYQGGFLPFPGSYAVFRTSDGEVVRSFVGAFSSVDLSPDGKLIALNGNSNNSPYLQVMRVSDGANLLSVYGGSDYVSFSSDGRYLVSVQIGPDKVCVYRVSDWECVRTIPGRYGIVALSPDGTRVATGIESSNIIQIWDVATGALISQVQGNGLLNQMSFSPDGQILVTGMNSRVSFWDVTSGGLLTYYNEETNGYDNRHGVLSVAYSSDGKFVYYGRGDGTVCTILNPYRNAILPNKGGNTGNVTVKIITPSTFPVPDGATVTLHDGVHPDISINATSINDYVLIGTINLSSAVPGKRDVVITRPDNQTETFPQGFTVEQGIEPSFITQLIGRSIVRSGRKTGITAIITNTGNVDAGNVPVWLVVSKGCSVDFDFALLPPPIDSLFDIDWTLVPVSVDSPSDSIHGFMSFVPAQGVDTYTINVSGATTFKVGGAATPPWGSGRYDECIKKLLDIAVSELLGYYFEFPETVKRQVNSLLLDMQTRAAKQYIAALAGSVIDNTRFKKDVSTWDWGGLGVSALEAAGVYLNASRLIAIGKVGSAFLLGFAIGEALNCFGIPPDGLARLLSTLDINTVASRDPNVISGWQGWGEARWVTPQQPLPFKVEFENLPAATVAAAEVVVTDHLDAVNLDLTTFTLGEIRFGNKAVTPTPDVALPVGKRAFTAEVDLRPETNLLVRVTAELDMLTGDLTTHFISLDPDTGLPPNDLRGFLPPNVNPPQGEGSIMFSVLPKPTVLTGTVTSNQASIVFDFNAPLVTNVWFNTIDNDKPVSQVRQLAGVQNSSAFTVSWQGQDVGSGLRDFTIYVSDNGGAYTPWLTNTSGTSATFTGQSGHTYAFYSQARDNTFNLEAPHLQPDTVTQVAIIATDVTSQIKVTRTTLAYNSSTKRFVQSVLFTNTGSAPITGPISLALDGLSSNATLFNKTGVTSATTPTGSPYLNAPGSSIAPGASVLVVLEFTNTDLHKSISYKKSLSGGAGPPLKGTCTRTQLVGAVADRSRSGLVASGATRQTRLMQWRQIRCSVCSAKFCCYVGRTSRFCASSQMLRECLKGFRYTANSWRESGAVV